jgi:hypothetical protein
LIAILKTSKAIPTGKANSLTFFYRHRSGDRVAMNKSASSGIRIAAPIVPGSVSCLCCRGGSSGLLWRSRFLCACRMISCYTSTARVQIQSIWAATTLVRIPITFHIALGVSVWCWAIVSLDAVAAVYTDDISKRLFLGV